MKGRRDPDIDLFAWADSRQSAVVIDARKIFQKRMITFVRLICLGYVPKETGGEIIDIQSRRGGKQRQKGKGRRRKDAA